MFRFDQTFLSYTCLNIQNGSTTEVLMNVYELYGV